MRKCKALLKKITLVFLFLSIYSLGNISFAEDDFYEDEDLEYTYNPNPLEINDPFEKVNRKIFKFNLKMNDYILRPSAKLYRIVTTKGLRQAINNFLNNLSMPIYFINYALQLDFDNSARSIASFTTNTFLGFFGFFDVSSSIGLNPESTNFGYTLAKYGVNSGPYMMIPFLGPMNIRSGFGKIADIALDPLAFDVTRIVSGDGKLLDLETKLVVWSFDYFNIADQVTTMTPMLDNAFDKYVFIRNAYLQNQQHKVNKIRGNI